MSIWLDASTAINAGEESTLTMTPYPLFFHPIFREKVWGGRSLERFGKRLPPGARVGECWELADLPETVENGRSRIANGPLKGRTMREAIDSHEREILGNAHRTPEGGFPLLIKFLDAQQNLSVQVHPNEQYVLEHPEAHLKSEAWIVLAAVPNAVIYRGVKPGITPEQFARHVEAGTVADDLIVERAEPGRCFYLPSGTVHALGAGIVVAEVQTPSDTTFRVFDWNRPQTSGRKLHVREALACIDFNPPPETRRAHPIEVGDIRTTIMAESPHFTIERIEIDRDRATEIITNGLPEVLMVLGGNGRIRTPDMPMIELSLGRTVLMPAALEGAVVAAQSPLHLLRVTLPSPLEGKIA